MKRLEEAISMLAEVQASMISRLDKVETSVGELKDKVSTLEERFNGLEGALYYGFDQLGRFAGVNLEELVRGIMTKNMQKSGELSQDKAITSIRLDGEEIDLFCDEPLIVGEVTSYAESVEEVDKLLTKVNIVRDRYGREPARKILIISSVKKEIADLIADKAKKSGIELIMGKRR